MGTASAWPQLLEGVSWTKRRKIAEAKSTQQSRGDRVGWQESPVLTPAWLWGGPRSHWGARTRSRGGQIAGRRGGSGGSRRRSQRSLGTCWMPGTTSQSPDLLLVLGPETVPWGGGRGPVMRTGGSPPGPPGLLTAPHLHPQTCPCPPGPPCGSCGRFPSTQSRGSSACRPAKDWLTGETRSRLLPINRVFI